MLWARMVAYVTGTVNQELLLRNEYLGAENRILRGQIKGRLLPVATRRAPYRLFAARGLTPRMLGTGQANALLSSSLKDVS